MWKDGERGYIMEKKVELKEIINKQRDFFNTNATKSVKYRIKMLQRLKEAIRNNEAAILSVLYKDLLKSKSEAYMSELAIVYAEINEALKNVRKWSRPEKVKDTIATFPAKNYVYSEPYGVVLIMAPWNYPFNLAISPLIAAIAAGNTAIIKCSKESVYNSKVIKYIINKAFSSNYIFCVDEDIDYDELIPVSLELGGKSPCIIDETADIKLAARRVLWGKLLNAGQTCVSVDYVLIHSSVKDRFIKYLQKELKKRYPNALNNDTYPRIINEHHYKRLMNLIKSEDSIIGGRGDDVVRRLEPTILPDVDFDHEIMKEEIFGPVLPIIEYYDINNIIRIIKEHEKPLACYVFTRDEDTAKYIIKSISYGGGCINDVILQVSNHYMPFGGVGSSGIGSYHGKFGFDTFSHKKSIVWSETMIDLPIRYAPFSPLKFRMLKKILESFNSKIN